MLEKIDFDVDKITKEEYKPLHKELVDRLVVLQQEARRRNIGLVVLFEGWNGAGKGGRISDLLYELDARATTVHVTANFNVEDARRYPRGAHGLHGLLPHNAGVLEGARPARQHHLLRPRLVHHRRAAPYLRAAPTRTLSDKKRRKIEKRLGVQAESFVNSIEDFESQLVDDGYVVVKFFLHISEKDAAQAFDRPGQRPVHGVARLAGRAGRALTTTSAPTASTTVSCTPRTTASRHGSCSTAKTSVVRT